IDFDLLAYADVRIDETDLTIPHPGIPERNFVLYPLAEIAPDLLIPGMGDVRALATRASAEGLQVLHHIQSHSRPAARRDCKRHVRKLHRIDATSPERGARTHRRRQDESRPASRAQ